MNHICKTMAGVAANAPNPSVPGFPGIFALLEDGAAHDHPFAVQENRDLASRGEAIATCVP